MPSSRHHLSREKGAPSIYHVQETQKKPIPEIPFLNAHTRQPSPPRPQPRCEKCPVEGRKPANKKKRIWDSTANNPANNNNNNNKLLKFLPDLKKEARERGGIKKENWGGGSRHALRMSWEDSLCLRIEGTLVASVADGGGWLLVIHMPPKMLFTANNYHYLSPLLANQTEYVMMTPVSCCLWEVTGYSLMGVAGGGVTPTPIRALALD